MTTAVFFPVANLVAKAWLSTLSLGINSDDITDGLKARDDWHQDLSITVTPVPSSANAFAPLRSPIIDINVWGRPIKSGSTRVPWNHCLAIAETIIDRTLPGSLVTGVLPIAGGSYMDARLTDVSCISSPYKILNEASGLARVLMTVQLIYVPVY